MLTDRTKNILKIGLADNAAGEEVANSIDSSLDQSASNITNDSSVSGSTLKDTLEVLDLSMHGICHVDPVTGYTTTEGDLFVDGNFFLRHNNTTAIYQMSKDNVLYHKIISYNNDNILRLGDVNMHCVSIPNDKSYKAETAAPLYPSVLNINLIGTDTSNSIICGDINANTLKFKVGGLGSSDAMVIMNGGNVSLTKQLKIGSAGGTVMGGEIDIVDAQVDAGSGAGGIGIASYRNTDIWGSYVYGVRYRGTLSVPTACQAGDSLMEFGCLGWDGSAPVGGGELIFLVDGVVSSGVVPTRAEIFVTKADGTFTQGLKIDKSLMVEAYGDIKLPGNITDGTNASSPAQIKSAVDSKYKEVSSCTLSTGLSSTVVLTANVVAGSKIFLQATSASAATMSGVYISAIDPGVSFTITYGVAAAGTETFNYLIF